MEPGRQFGHHGRFHRRWHALQVRAFLRHRGAASIIRMLTFVTVCIAVRRDETAECALDYRVHLYLEVRRTEYGTPPVFLTLQANLRIYLFIALLVTVAAHPYLSHFRD